MLSVVENMVPWPAGSLAGRGGLWGPPCPIPQSHAAGTGCEDGEATGPAEQMLVATRFPYQGRSLSLWLGNTGGKLVCIQVGMPVPSHGLP